MQLDLTFADTAAEAAFRQQRVARGASLLTGVEATRMLAWLTVATSKAEGLGTLLAALGALSSALVALAAACAVGRRQ